MDVLTDVLAATRTGQAGSVQTTPRGPWTMEINDPDRTGFHVVLKGAAVIWETDRPEQVMWLSPGDIVLSPAGKGHVIADAPARHRAAADPGCPGAADAALLCGWFEHGAATAHPLLAALPPLLVVSSQHGRRRDLAAAVDLLAAETATRQPGTDAVVARLVEILLVLAVRAWLDSEPADESCPPWLTGLRDPLTQRALQALHEAPSRPWTVQALADHLQVSRPTLARRFADHLGEGPMSYLTRWRMTLAAQQLRDTDAPIEAIAHRSGYASSYAFSKAFTRTHGQAPTHFRRAMTGRAGNGDLLIMEPSSEGAGSKG
ncbi:AraC family transcriptional regulator [Streptomyces sp. cg36]|uniref:helix-turn-helix transcriptional regulator n=1 Tax=Streptomyces sp. cg36 TaxID=3238798 RepID=UPI0034E20566